MIPITIEAALMVLRTSGWTCIPPRTPEDAIPDPAVGQVWHSTRPRGRALPRRVIDVGSNDAWPGDKCVYWVVDGEIEGGVLNPRSWRAWVRVHGARPAA